MDRRFHTLTLGCKLNQFDTAAIEGELVRRGLSASQSPEGVEVIVVNTCTVTHRADADARKLIRRVRRANPDAALLVTGCYAERDAEAIERIGGVDLILGNHEKVSLPRALDDLGIVGTGSGAPEIGDRGCDGAIAGLHFGERSRAFLKVQGGCRLSCSYCIIPTVRGESRSVPVDAVVRTARRLVEGGYREIVLTGVNTGDYGRDLMPETNLAALLRRLLEACAPARLRLNSLEPRTVTDEIVALFADGPRLAAHLQVPLQSGCDETLAGMRRNYRTDLYLERLAALRRAVPHIGLGADVIVGFPGETEERFERSVSFIERSPLNYLHVFSWSAREGTDAAGMAERVDPAVIAARSERMRAVGRRLADAFRRSRAGDTVDAVVLGERRQDGRWRVLTSHFLDVAVAGHTAPGELVDVRLEWENGLSGRIVA